MLDGSAKKGEKAAIITVAKPPSELGTTSYPFTLALGEKPAAGEFDLLSNFPFHDH